MIQLADARLLAVDDADFGELLRISLADNTDVWIRASGNSMAPTIPDGALVRLTGLAGRLHVGDIVLVHRERRGFALHRITRIRRDEVTTIGDNRLDADPPISARDIVALADAVQVSGVGRSLSVGRGVTTFFQLRRIARRVVRSVWRFLPRSE